MLARSLIGKAVRDQRGAALGRVRDIGFAAGELRYCRTDRGIFEIYARAGDRLIAGRPANGEGLWLRAHPRLQGDMQRTVQDFVLSGGLAAPLCIVTRGLMHDLLHGRELLPTTRVVCEDSHDLPQLR
ncbi:MAG: PRC-barrel domain-containing protein [Thermaerobacter sp.]|nr:PRC-barrel domain-containing protein [Thermaerobacter sp.]